MPDKRPTTRYESTRSKDLRKPYEVKVTKSGDVTLDEILTQVATRVNNDPRYKKAVDSHLKKKGKK